MTALNEIEQLEQQLVAAKRRYFHELNSEADALRKRLRQIERAMPTACLEPVKARLARSSPTSGSNSVSRVLELLRGQPLTVAEIRSRTGLTLDYAYKTIAALKQRQLVHRVGESQPYAWVAVDRPVADDAK